MTIRQTWESGGTMLPRPTFRVPALVACLAGLLAAGCSILGHTIGKGLDSRRSGECTLAQFGADAIRPGTIVRVSLTDGGEVRGAYRGQAERPAVAYDNDYEQFRGLTQATLPLPALGDSLWVTLRSGDRERVCFRGFDHLYHAGAAQPGGQEHHCLSLATHRGSNTRVSWDVASLRQIEGENGLLLNEAALSALASRPDLPGRTALFVADRNGLVAVPLERVSVVHRVADPALRWLGFGAGLGVDLSFLAFLFIGAAGAGGW
jgi:hypothetical protein